MFSNIGAVQLLIILVIVLVIFGPKRLRTLGSDLGKSIKGFRSAMSENDQTEQTEQIGDASQQEANFDNTPVEENRKENDS